ncbi:MAG: hypothetical protein NTY14_03835 [Candidatus Omnitrophica bacterium]|nr:hypothetical protein [Candidatus Omnitrophota bacterium]
MSGMTSRIKIKADINLLTVLGMFIFFLTGAFAQGQPQVNADVEGIVLKPGVSYTAENLRDPFTNPVLTETSPDTGDSNTNIPEVHLPAMKVQGIFWGGKFPQAIINDKVVKVNEKIDNVQILEITKDSVTVFFGNKQFVLTSPAFDNLEASSNKKDAKKGGNQ